MCSNFDFQVGNLPDALVQFGVTKNHFTAFRDGYYPKQPVAVIGQAGTGRRVMFAARWGLIPADYNDPDQQPQPFNARADTVTRYAMFRESFAERRVIIPGCAFYEWTRATPKRRYRLAPPDPSALWGFAGICDSWEAEGHPRVLSAAMVTTGPNDLIATFHDRCPVILRPEDYARWLDPATPERDLVGLLVPWPSEGMMMVEAMPQRAKTEPAPRVQKSAARKSRKPDTPGLFDPTEG